MSFNSKELEMVQKITKEEDGVQRVERKRIPVEIYEAEFDSIDRIMESVGGLLAEIQHLPEIDALFDVFVDRSQAVNNHEWKTKEGTKARQQEVDEVIAAEQARFNESIKQNIFPILNIALTHAPGKLFTVLAAATDIDEKLLRQQPLSLIPDVLDAVAEVNDIPKLTGRLKNSFSLWMENIRRGNQNNSGNNLEAVSSQTSNQSQS